MRLLRQSANALMCRLAVLAFAAADTGTAKAGELYSTDFEDFTVGDNQWAGTDGWVSNDTTSGAQGIVQDYYPVLPLGKTAYLGFSPPAAGFTTVYRTIHYDPATGKIPVVTLDTFIGIQDSTTGGRDRFYVSFYNISGDFLAAICFDNTSRDLLRLDGVAQHDTGVDFVRGNPILGFVQLDILEVSIDLVANRWSAALEGVPLFAGAPFTATGLPINLGATAVEWEVAGGVAGNNWIFVADWYVETAPKGVEPFRVESVSRSESGGATVQWPSDIGFDYKVEYSDDLRSWQDDLPGSSFPGIVNAGTLSFTDSGAGSGMRFYRVIRTVSP